MVGELLLSTATSPQERLTAGLKSLGDTTNNSPKRKNPKKADAAIAKMRVLSSPGEMSSVSWILVRIWTVIGSLVLGASLFLSAYALLMPARTLLSTGRDDWSRGSGRPKDNWRFRTAER